MRLRRSPPQTLLSPSVGQKGRGRLQRKSTKPNRRLSVAKTKAKPSEALQPEDSAAKEAKEQEHEAKQ